MLNNVFLAANPENIESKLYIELLRLGLKIINDVCRPDMHFVGVYAFPLLTCPFIL